MTKKKDLRCYYCRRKAKTTLNGHPSCGGAHGVAVTPGPVVRPMLRNGRASFLRALRGKIEKVPIVNAKHDDVRVPNDVKIDVLKILDAAIERYKGA
jgi:hypothetical protein